MDMEDGLSCRLTHADAQVAAVGVERDVEPRPGCVCLFHHSRSFLRGGPEPVGPSELPMLFNDR